VLFLKYVSSGQKDYIVVWTRDKSSLEDGGLRNLQRLSDDTNFVRLKVELFIDEAEHSGGDDLPAENLDALEKTASELLKANATSTDNATPPDSLQKEPDVKSTKPKKAAAKRARENMRRKGKQEEDSSEDTSTAHEQQVARELALVEQHMRVQGEKSTKEMHDLHKEVKRGFERTAEAIEGLADAIRARPAAAALPAAYGTYAPPSMPSAPAYAAPAPPAPPPTETQRYHRSSERRPSSPHRGASDEELDEMYRLFRKKMKQRDQAARREAEHD
jgi:hypothetical protein